MYKLSLLSMEFNGVKDILSDLKKGVFYPVYIFHGTEPYYIDLLTNWIESNALTEGEKAFNQSILYGRELSMKNFLDHARQFPMMSQRRVVIVKEAQAMRDIKNFDSYLEAPSDQTIAVISHKKKLDGRLKWIKEAKKSPKVAMLNSQPVPDYKMNQWISSYATDHSLVIKADASEMIVQYLGNDLKKVSNELEKIRLNLPEGDAVTSDLVQKYIGISRDYDVFGLLKALSQGDIPMVQRITLNIVANEKVQPLQMVIPGMATYFEKVIIVAQNLRKDDKTIGRLIGAYPSFVREYRNMAQRFGLKRLMKVYELLVEADGYSKGFNRKNSKGVLQELVGKIILCQTY